MLEAMLSTVMSAKAEEACGAEYGSRDPERQNSRNGYRKRGLSTSAGDLTLRIPKLRQGTFFPDDVIERYCRIDRALMATAVEMYAMGAPTRKVEGAAAKLGVKPMSESQVPRLCECLDAEADSFRRQRFDCVRFAYLWLDAAYVKCRAEGRSVSQAIAAASGLGDTGHKRFVGVERADAECYADWKELLVDLRTRGIDGVRLVVSDVHESLVKAIGGTFQGAAWQRCITHFMGNASSYIHEKGD